MSANDYYSENESVGGIWVGKGSPMLGLEGKTIGKEDAAFEALRMNRHPDGSGQLTPRNVGNSIRFFDFQCSAQKSVSLMAVTLGDRRLLEAHDRAALKALSELEKFASIQTGQSVAKHRRTTGNLCAAAFRHDASRQLDPQLHTHFVVANATWDSRSRRWFALETHDMFKAIRYAGKAYQNELAWECRRLGYQIEHVRTERGLVEGFEIRGVSPELRQRFSKRRQEVEAGIEAFRAEFGRDPTPSEISFITRETRSGKLKEITTPEVVANQRSQLSSSDLAELEDIRKKALENRAPPNFGSDRQALASARDHLFERHSVLQGHAVLAEALNQKLGYLTLEGLKHNLSSDYSGMVQLTESHHNPALSEEFSTRQGLEVERWCINFVNGTQDHLDSLGLVEAVTFDFKSDEQRRVVLETLANRDQVYGIRGRAGAGKTTSLQEIRKGLEAAARNVTYLAPTAAAVQVLKQDGFRQAITVSDFLCNQADHKPLRNAVLIVDEAGLQSNKQGVELLKIAQRNRARVLFVGDTRQHTAVEAGDFLRVLESHSKLHTSELTDIRRQVVAEYNAAIRTMASGHTAAGMEQLDALGWVHEAKGHYIDQAATAYVAASAKSGRIDDCVAITPTWAENHRLTQAIRSQLKERGLLTEGTRLTVNDPLEWTAPQRATAANFSPGMIVHFHADAGKARRGQSFIVESVKSGRLFLQGRSGPIDPARYASRFSAYQARDIEISSGDRILIRRNHRASGLINGQLLTVQKIQKDGTVETLEGKTLPPSFRTFCHGYVVTSHKSQGRTHNKVIVAAEQLNAKAAYVACSRGRSQCLVYTPDKTAMLSTLDRSGDRKAAFDVLNSAAARLGAWFRGRTETIRQVMIQAGNDHGFVPSSMPTPAIESSSLRFTTEHEL